MDVKPGRKDVSGDHDGAAVQVSLRLLATTDLHMELGATAPGGIPHGLEALAAPLAVARAEADNCLYFDNGDLLQGNPLGDAAAAWMVTAPGQRRNRPQPVHPAIACMNALGCDAATPGNHDFAFGPHVFAAAAKEAAYPIVIGNMRGPGLDGFARSVVLRRQMTTHGGGKVEIAVGVTGVMPPQTAAWEAASWPGLEPQDACDAVRREIPLLHAAGADIVVVLCHGGAVSGPCRSGAENPAAAIAALTGVDAVIAGHLHVVDPPENIRQAAQEGLAPIVSAGAWGSHLGVIDLTLQGSQQGWSVTAASVENRPAATPSAQPAAPLRALLAPSLRRAAKMARHPSGRLNAPLTSHFARLGVAPGLRLVAQAQRWHLRRKLAGTRWEGWPILVAAAPFLAGGLRGPANFLDLPMGRLRRGDLAALYAFPNRNAAIVVTGADIACWLEHLAASYVGIRAGMRDVALLNPKIPPYSIDLIDGISCELDLTAPAHHAALPPQTGAGGQRIRALRHRGRPVAPDARFILATNSYRMAATGAYRTLVAGRPVLPVGDARIRDILAIYLRRRRQIAPDNTPFFTFTPIDGASALFETAPNAIAHLARCPLPVEPAGIDSRGFQRLRLELGSQHR